MLSRGLYRAELIGFSAPVVQESLRFDRGHTKIAARFLVTHRIDATNSNALPKSVEIGAFIRPIVTFSAQTGVHSRFVTMLAALLDISIAELMQAIQDRSSKVPAELLSWIDNADGSDIVSLGERLKGKPIALIVDVSRITLDGRRHFNTITGYAPAYREPQGV